mmetsp:Transcript_23279/g.55172  ORF Transcript_23279/g.55172 Transcript_23279/m.55172 type:complete len:442 (-) Transcript_23279:97-1422(-)
MIHCGNNPSMTSLLKLLLLIFCLSESKARSFLFAFGLTTTSSTTKTATRPVSTLAVDVRRQPHIHLYSNSISETNNSRSRPSFILDVCPQSTTPSDDDGNDDEQYQYNDSASPDPIASQNSLDELIPRSNIKAWSMQKSNVQAAKQTMFHFGVYTLAAALTPINRPISLLLMAYVSSFFFCGLHECIHNTAFRTKQLNTLMAHIFGFLTVRPAIHYFHYHWRHHKYTGDIKNDSELQAGSFLDLEINSWSSYLLYLSGIPFWIDAWISLLRHATGRCDEMYLTNPKAKQQVRREARIYTLLYTLVAVAGATRRHFATILLQFWVLPAIFGQPFLRFYLMGEHRGRINIPRDIFANTRTITSISGWYRRLAWNMPYHAEHHAWPSVPFYRLNDVHDRLIEENGTELFDQGEIYPELRTDNGRTDYVSLNWRFLKRLTLRTTR